MTKFALGEGYSASILLLAAQDDFVQNVRKLQFTGLILAIVVGAAFLPHGLDVRQPHGAFAECHYRAGTKTPDILLSPILCR